MWLNWISPRLSNPPVENMPIQVIFIKKTKTERERERERERDNIQCINFHLDQSIRYCRTLNQKLTTCCLSILLLVLHMHIVDLESMASPSTIVLTRRK